MHVSESAIACCRRDEVGEARRETGRGNTASRNKKSTKKCGAYIARSRIRNSRRNVTVRIDDYDDITLIWLLCIIRGIELAKDSPRDEGRGREGGRKDGERARIELGACVKASERDSERRQESDWDTEEFPERRWRRWEEEEVALVIAHTCKFRPARIPMREGGIVSDKEPPAPSADIERREEGC